MALIPSFVAIKRKRAAAPISSLVFSQDIDSSNSINETKTQNDEEEQAEEGSVKRRRVITEYKLESTSQLSNNSALISAGSRASVAYNPNTDDDRPSQNIENIEVDTKPRHYQLAPLPVTRIRGSKRAHAEVDNLPTFVEVSALKRIKSRHNLVHKKESNGLGGGSGLKRPGTKKIYTPPNIKKDITDEQSNILSAQLHAFALEETRSEQIKSAIPLTSTLPSQAPSIVPVKPKVLSQPKNATRRKKPSPTAAVPPGENDVTMRDSSEHSDDKDYVYDIYIRSTPRTISLATPSSPPLPSTSETRLQNVETDSTAPRSLINSPFPSQIFTSNQTSLDRGIDGDRPGGSVGFLHLPLTFNNGDVIEGGEYLYTTQTGEYTYESGSELDTEDKKEKKADEEGDDEDSNAEEYWGADYPDESGSEDEYRPGRFGDGDGDEDEYGGKIYSNANDYDDDEDDNDDNDGGVGNPFTKGYRYTVGNDKYSWK